MQASSDLLLATQTLKSIDPTAWASQISALADQNARLLDAALSHAVGATHPRFASLSSHTRVTLSVLALVAADIAGIQDTALRRKFRDELLDVSAELGVSFDDVLQVITKSSVLESAVRRT